MKVGDKVRVVGNEDDIMRWFGEEGVVTWLGPARYLTLPDYYNLHVTFGDGSQSVFCESELEPVEPSEGGE